MLKSTADRVDTVTMVNIGQLNQWTLRLPTLFLTIDTALSVSYFLQLEFWWTVAAFILH